jgi:Oxidoreductase molybdopterin binding domain
MRGSARADDRTDDRTDVGAGGDVELGVTQARRRPRLGPSGLTHRQVNLALEILIVGAIATGLLSWSLGDRWNGALTFAHGVAGIAVALLVPAKLRGSVRTGFRRGRATRWLSTVFGVLVLLTLTLGIVHATGIWFGVGQWTALWTHELAGFSLVPFLIWHVVSRPVKPSPHDLQRRALLKLGGLAAVAAAVHVTQRASAGAVGLAGGDRRGTGSHEVASRDPAQLPKVIWLNDRAPADTDAAGWNLVVNGERVEVDAVRSLARPVVATLDCTGGWWSEQVWDAVPLSDLITEPFGRSVRVESITGYGRHFPRGDLADIYLAVGYSGEPLRRGHGAPVRLVVPGRRGPEWIKWVTTIECSDRPSWLQPPLPLS